MTAITKVFVLAGFWALQACGPFSIETSAPPPLSQSTFALAIKDLSERDLAVIIPFDQDQPIRGSERIDGQKLLSEAWVTAVDTAYRKTPVLDALVVENRFADWQLVSARIIPCLPVGISPKQKPQKLCWPYVRLVWQPVIEKLSLNWATFAHYADDRAIHAIYPVQARLASGMKQNTNVLAQVRAQLRASAPTVTLSNNLLASFLETRDRTVKWLLSQVAQLRDQSISQAQYQGLGIRPEFFDELSEKRFRSQFLAFLAQVARPQELEELTAFSLPEGRVPAQQDRWVFLAFDAHGGQLTQRELEVYDPETGGLLVNLGLDQSVTTIGEDPEAIKGLQDPQRRQALLSSVVFDPATAGALTHKIADPHRILTPNTTCASCHRLNSIRFDLHNLSHLEERSHTISPRVTKEIAKDLQWLGGMRE